MLTVVPNFSSAFTQKWKIATETGVSSKLAVADNIVFYTVANDGVYALDASTGKQMWQVSLPGAWITAPVAADDRVFFIIPNYTGSSRSEGTPAVLYALNAQTGGVEWKYTVDIIERFSESSLTLADGLLYFSSGWDNSSSSIGHVVALAASTGNLVWRKEIAGPLVAGISVKEGITAFSDGIDTDRKNDVVYAVDSKTGKEIWEHKQPTKYDMSDGTATMNDGIVYYALDDTLYAFDGETGKELWHVQKEYSTSQIASYDGQTELGTPVFDGETLYVTGNLRRLFCIDNCGPGGHYIDRLYAFDAGTGQEKWELQGEDEEFLDLNVFDHVLYYTTYHPDYIKGLDPQTGQTIWQYRLGGNSFSPLTFVDGIFYVGDSALNMYALVPPVKP